MRFVVAGDFGGGLGAIVDRAARLHSVLQGVFSLARARKMVSTCALACACAGLQGAHAHFSFIDFQ